MPMPRMKLMSDVDGVLLDFVSMFAYWISKNYPEIELEREKWHFGLEEKRAWELCEMFWETEWMAKLPFFPGVKDGINNLVDLFQIHIVTALPHRYEYQRKLNLSSINYDVIQVIGKDKEHHVIDVLRPTVAIEDKPSTIQNFHDAGIDVYYPDTPLTVNVIVGTKYQNWTELVKMIREKYDV